MQLGRSLTWDPAKGVVVNDAEANKLLRRPYRAPWVHPDPAKSLIHNMRTPTLTLIAVTAALATGYGYQTGQWPPPLQQVPDESPVLSPAESMKKIVLPPGYRLELVASEPMIEEPVAIDWDSDGRLWVVEMPGYMEDMPATTELQPTGRVSVLEDTNDDGRMDKKTVFLDKLVLPRASRCSSAACSSASRRTCGSPAIRMAI